LQPGRQAYIIKKLAFMYILPGKAQGPCLKLCGHSMLHFSSQADHIHRCISQQLIGPAADIDFFF